MQRTHRKAHAMIWTILAIGLPAALGIAMLSAPRFASDAPSVRLDPPAATLGASP